MLVYAMFFILKWTYPFSVRGDSITICKQFPCREGGHYMGLWPSGPIFPLFAHLILQQGKKESGCFPRLYCSIGNVNWGRLSLPKSDQNFIAISGSLLTKHIMEKGCVWRERNKTCFQLFTLISHTYKTKMNGKLVHSSISSYKS